MVYIINKDLGYDKNYVFMVLFFKEVVKSIDVIENEL